MAIDWQRAPANIPTSTNETEENKMKHTTHANEWIAVIVVLVVPYIISAIIGG